MYRPNSLHCRWVGVWGVNKKLTLCLVCAQAKISAQWTERVGGGVHEKTETMLYLCAGQDLSPVDREGWGGGGGYMKRLRPCFICVQAKISAQWTERVGGWGGTWKDWDHALFVCRPRSQPSGQGWGVGGVHEKRALFVRRPRSQPRDREGWVGGGGVHEKTETMLYLCAGQDLSPVDREGWTEGLGGGGVHEKTETMLYLCAGQDLSPVDREGWGVGGVHEKTETMLYLCAGQDLSPVDREGWGVGGVHEKTETMLYLCAGQDLSPAAGAGQSWEHSQTAEGGADGTQSVHQVPRLSLTCSLTCCSFSLPTPLTYIPPHLHTSHHTYTEEMISTMITQNIGGWGVVQARISCAYACRPWLVADLD